MSEYTDPYGRNSTRSLDGFNPFFIELFLFINTTH